MKPIALQSLADQLERSEDLIADGLRRIMDCQDKLRAANDPDTRATLTRLRNHMIALTAQFIADTEAGAAQHRALAVALAGPPLLAQEAATAVGLCLDQPGNVVPLRTP